MIQGHQPSATTHINTNVNLKNCSCVMFFSQVGLIGYSKAEGMLARGNDDAGNNQAPRMTMWQGHANMDMGRAQMMMTPR